MHFSYRLKPRPQPVVGCHTQSNRLHLTWEKGGPIQVS